MTNRSPSSIDEDPTPEAKVASLPAPAPGAEVHNMAVGIRNRVRTYQGEPGAGVTDRVIAAVLASNGRVLWSHAISELDDLGMSRAVLVLIFLVPGDVSDRWPDFLEEARNGRFGPKSGGRA